MPNHTANNFSITGPIADIRRFIKAVTTKDTNLDFMGVLPMPTDLIETSYPVRIQTQAEINLLWESYNKNKEDGKLSRFDIENGKPHGLGITQVTSDRLLREYGFNNWYEWSVANWGTKWNAYDVGEWSVGEGGNGEGRATIYYETAWSPATQLWVNASTLYPTLVFFHEFADEGGGFLGDETIVNGQISDENKYDWHSDEGINLRERLGRYHPEDEVDEVND